MIGKVKKAMAIAGLLGVIPWIAFGQISLDSIPPTTNNARFYTDVFSGNSGIEQVKHPGFSIIGFDNGGDNSKGNRQTAASFCHFPFSESTI